VAPVALDGEKHMTAPNISTAENALDKIVVLLTMAFSALTASQAAGRVFFERRLKIGIEYIPSC